tara:strand:- start:50 stop:2647 length:2598 start_codon:yes stop_codon:yes gene_type:complete
MYTIDGKYKNLIEKFSSEECESKEPINLIIPKNYYNELATCNITPEETFNSIEIVNDKFKIYKNDIEKKVDDIVTVNDINYIDYNNIDCARNKLNDYYDELKSGTVINSLEDIGKNFSGSEFINITYFIIDGLRDFGYINNLKITKNSEVMTFFPENPDSFNKLEESDNIKNFKVYINNEIDDLDTSYVPISSDTSHVPISSDEKYHRTLVHIGDYDIENPQNDRRIRFKEDKYGDYDTYGLIWKVINIDPENTDPSSKMTRIEGNNKYPYINNINNDWIIEDKIYDNCGNEIDIGDKKFEIEVELNKIYFTIRDKNNYFSTWDDNIYIYMYCTKPKFNLIVENVDNSYELSKGWKHVKKSDLMYLEIANNSRIKFSLKDNSKFNLESFNFIYPFPSLNENNVDTKKPIMVVRTDKSDNSFLFTYEGKEETSDISSQKGNTFINTDSIKIDNPRYNLNEFKLDIFNDKGKIIKDVKTKLKSDDKEINPSWFSSDGTNLQFGNIYPPQYSLDVEVTDEDNNITKKSIPIFIKFSNTDLVPHILTKEIIVNYNEYAEIYLETENKNGNNEIIQINAELLKKNGERHNASWFSTKYKTIIFDKPPIEYDQFLNLINYDLEVIIENRVGKKRKKVIPIIFKYDNKEFIFDNVISKSIQDIKRYPKDNIPFYKELLANLISKYKELNDQSKLHFNRSERLNVPIDNIEIDLNKLGNYKDKLNEFNSGMFFERLSQRIDNLNLNSEMVDNPVKVVIPINVELDNKLFNTFNIQKDFIENPDMKDLNKYQNLAKDIYSKYSKIKNRSKLNLEEIPKLEAPSESLRINSNFNSLNNSINTINENQLIKNLIKSKDIDSDIDSIKLLLPITFDK